MIHVGDCLEVLRGMEAESVHCVVTSPPYWALRKYGDNPGEYGSEPTIAQYIENQVAVFREVRRVLRKDGTCWVNIGDTYWASGGASSNLTGKQGTNVGSHHKPDRRNPKGELKPKDRCMIPARFALALQADGWWLRDEIIWHKPNPMPSSVRDRTTPAHEMIYLLTKSARYWYDADAIRTEPSLETKQLSHDTMDFKRRDTYKMPDGWDTGEGAHGSIHRNGREKGAKPDKQRGHSRQHAGFNDRWDAMGKEEQCANGANARSVWTISTVGFAEAHFATFPPELPKRCILAGCPAGGVVLDPYLGSGTTSMVAVQLGRQYVGIELYEAYAEMARHRIADVTPAFNFEDVA